MAIFQKRSPDNPLAALQPPAPQRLPQPITPPSASIASTRMRSTARRSVADHARSAPDADVTVRSALPSRGALAGHAAGVWLPGRGSLRFPDPTGRGQWPSPGDRGRVAENPPMSIGTPDSPGPPRTFTGRPPVAPVAAGSADQRSAAAQQAGDLRDTP